MFVRLAQLMYRRRWYVLAVWVVVLVISGGLASQVGSVLGPGDFVIDGSDSAKAAKLLDLQFHRNDMKNTFVVIHDSKAALGSAAFDGAVATTVQRIRSDSALRINYLDNPVVTHDAQLIGRDRHSVAVFFSSNLSEQDIEAQIDHLRTLVRRPGLTTYVTGTPASNHDFAISSKDDLNKGESLTVPILVLILLLVFGTVVATSLPLALAVSSILLSTALVFIFGHFINTSVYVTNVVTVLGLGVGIDYSLFIVYRFREELRVAGDDVEQAVIRTMETTGRAVFFSGLTVAIGLSSLILTGVSFMQSMGLGGVVVPVTALLVAMTVLPALLSVLGTRVNRWRLLPRRFLQVGDSGGWHRLATTIMQRPIVSGGVVLAVLLGLALPLTQLSLAFGGLKNSPPVESVAGFRFMQAHLPSQPSPTQVVVSRQGPGTLLAPQEIAGLRTLENRLRQDPEVLRVAGPADFASGLNTSVGFANPSLRRYLSADNRTALLSVVARDTNGTKAVEDLVRRARSLATGLQSTALVGDVVYVGGAQANFTDWNDTLYGKFPYIIVLVLALTYGFLFYAFRSAFLPLKAVLLNLLSVGAAYGALQLVFQQGIGHQLLGFSPESGVAGWVPIFLFAFLFGLSMDYEVLLLSRVREIYLATGNNTYSVAHGLEKTGRLISSAAAIMVIAFSGFLIGHQIQLKEFGFGLMFSIAIDATLIRVILVPSIMALMGNANWWVPKPLRHWAGQGSALGEGDLEPLPVYEREAIR